MAEAGYQIYRPGEWKELTKGKNFLRSQQLVRVDRLVAEFDRADTWVERLTILTNLIESVADYLDHGGSRSEQVRTLGFQVINMMKRGGPDRSVTYTHYMSRV